MSRQRIEKTPAAYTFPMEKVEKAKKGRILPYILFCLLPLAGGALSGLISRSGMDRYEQLAQPPLSPPRILFPIVWSILYILMGIGAARVYLAPERGWKPALTLFAAQLLVNLLWTPLFFALELRFAAFIWLLVLLVLAVYMTGEFKRIAPWTGYMQIPYLLWLSFAAYLNFATWQLNG